MSFQKRLLMAIMLLLQTTLLFEYPSVHLNLESIKNGVRTLVEHLSTFHLVYFCSRDVIGYEVTP